ncbi:uncharacterized protein N7503_006633 [Penicillium pulvis]|uniref:uncharacterized protein n=1 Tax=Penicillium pulvis TaxID=1562058 RepID=UPI0025474862|nr:uncharacterized protein N7503_006633 [Penicillium pulvis]KAJ5797337.1 hypothetical protein N7503_006633 [Penicillium pulvis]
MAPSSSQKEVNYQPLASDEPEALTSSLAKPPSLSSRAAVTIVPVVVTFTIALILGWLTGQHFSDRKWDGLISPPGNVEVVFEHDLLFSERPTPESEAAWNSLIPVGRGFVHHPEIAPFISNLAVFHQLHCLHAIVVSYYTAIEDADVARGGQRPDEFLEETGTRMAQSHVRHCFDYIRQTLMCGADTNLEVLDYETRATSGWGQKRQCRSYHEVYEWAEKWANSTDTGILS